MSKKPISELFALGMITLILLVEYRFFFLIRIPDFIQRTMTYHNKLLIFILCFSWYLIYGLNRKKKIFSFLINVFIMLIFISMFYSFKKYDPQIDEILVPAVAYLTIFLYFPLRKFLINNFSFFVKVLTWFNIIASLILLLQYLVYSFSGNLFLSVYEFYRSGEIAVRNGNIRITYLGTIVSFSCILSIGIFFKYKGIVNKRRIFHLCNIALSLIYFQVVSQTRMYVVSTVATLILHFYYKLSNDTNKWLKRIVLIVGLVFIGFSVGLNDYISNFIEPLRDGSYIYDGSYYARLDSVEFFSQVAMDKPFLGNGILSPNTGSLYYSQIRGVRGQSFYTDVGLIGTAAQFGFFMVVWYVLLLLKIFKIRILTKDSIINSLFLFILITSATLIVLDPQRILFLTISLAVIDAIKVKENQVIQ